MKKKIYNTIIAGSLCVGLSLIASCTAGFDELNRPGEKVTDEELNRDNFKLQSYFMQMTDNVFPVQENSFQMNENLIGDVYGRYLMTANEKWNMLDFSTYNAPDGWINYPFDDVMQKIYTPWFEIKASTNGIGLAYAWSQVLRVAAMHRIGDMYGALPYSKVGSGDLEVPYDDMKSLYHNMLTDLTDAIDVMTEYTRNNSDLFMADADEVYGGDVTKWVKFANSLKLRLAMRLSKVEPDYAKQMAEEAVNHSIGVIVSNADNASYPYPGNAPLWKICVTWGDSRACADIVSYMVGYEDPRLSLYFEPVTFAGTDGVFAGIKGGAQLVNKAWANQYSCPVATQNDRTYWLNAAEVAFNKAEAALYGWNMGGTAEALYNEGIRLSFDQWGARGADTYLENATLKPANYDDPGEKYSSNAVSTITIKWEEGNQEASLERIITQKWIAMYPNGQEAWSEYRRTGYPKFFDLPVATNYPTLPTVANRIPFNRNEYINNKANVEAAVVALGGEDNYATKVWWAK